MNKNYYVCDECMNTLKKDRVEIILTTRKGDEYPDLVCQRCGEELDSDTLNKIIVYSKDIIHLLPRIDVVPTTGPTTFMKILRDCDSEEDLKDLEKLIKSCPYLVNQKNSLGYFPLGYVCYMQPLADIRYKIMKLLIDNGADVNAKTSRGHTAITSSHENYIKIKILLENGASVGDALFYVTKPHILDLLLQYPVDKNIKVAIPPIHAGNALDYHTSKKSDMNIITKLLDYGFEIGYYGSSSLHNGRYDTEFMFGLAYKLIDYPQFDVNKRDELNNSFVYNLLSSNDYQRMRTREFTNLLKKMIDRNLDVDAKLGSHKKTLFYFVAKYLLPEQTKELLDYVIDKNIKFDRRGMAKNLNTPELSDYYFDVCLSKDAMKKVVGMLCTTKTEQIPNELLNEIFKI